MKKIFTLVFAVITFAANAQFSIQPQIGLENSRTTITSNDFSSFSPLGLQFAPRVAVRMNYKLKTGHGAYFGVATSSPAIEFKFTDPQAARRSYKATAKELQFRLEGGYQFTSKPISLCNTGSSNTSGHSCGGGKEQTGRTACAQHSNSHCSSANYHRTAAADKGWYVRIVPSAGLAFIPSEDNEIETETEAGQTSYEYKAGFKTAFMAGTAFEFGSRTQSMFVVSLNYLKGLDNSQETLNTVASGKSITTSLKSKTSSFTISLGIPFSLTKNKTGSDKKQCERPVEQHRCGQYRMYH